MVVFSSELILICLKCLGAPKRRTLPLPSAMECFVGGTVRTMFRGSRQSRTTSRGRGARVKPVPKTERQTIQRREHSILKKHHSLAAIGRQRRSERHGWVRSPSRNYESAFSSNTPPPSVHGHATSRVERRLVDHSGCCLRVGF